MPAVGPMGYRYADLQVGMAFRSPGRTITDADLVAFAGLTGDYSELHTSDVYAKASQFGRRVAHGMLGLAYAHGLMWARTGELRETAVAFLGISDWKFLGPIFVGDTIFVNYVIAELRDSQSRPTQAIATFDVSVVTQDDRLVQQGKKALLLSKVPVPVSQQFPVSTEGEPAERAAGYAATLAHSFSVAEDAAPPPFDLILLGLGDDGHTASLFPKAPALQEQKSWVTWSPPGTLPPPVDRVTFTLPLINAGRQILFLVSGQRKTLAVRDVLEGGASPSQRPAAGVHPADGTLTWLLDEPAAQLLSKS